MKIVILSSRFPYPLEKGDKLRLFYQMRGLASHHELHLISLHEDPIREADKRQLEKICASVHTLRLPKARSWIRGARALLNSRPFQVNYFYSPALAKKIDQHIHEIGPDVIMCQLLRMAEYCRHYSMPKVLDYMDCFSLNYRKRSTFESFPASTFFRNEAKRLSKYEKEIAKYFQGRTIIAQRDKDEIEVNEEIEVVSNGIDTDLFSPREAVKHNDLLFVGNMGYHPNVLAALMLAKKILPALKTTTGIRIAGARPTPQVMALASEKMEVTGWVDDIRDEYARAKIFIAPIFSGAGQQNKILEAMAMELICITTPSVNAAIGAKHGEHLLIAENEAAFVALVEDLQSNIDLYRKMGEKARTFVCDHFSWEVENKKLSDIIIKVGNGKYDGETEYNRGGRS